MGGDIGNLTRAGLERVGVSPSTIDTAAKYARRIPYVGTAAAIMQGPGSKDVEAAITPYTGEFYQPKTMAGQYASSIASAIPSAAIPGGGGLAA